MLQVYPVPGWTSCILAQDTANVAVQLKVWLTLLQMLLELFHRYSFPSLTAVLSRLTCRVTVTGGHASGWIKWYVVCGYCLLAKKSAGWACISLGCWEGGEGSVWNGRLSQSILVNRDILFLHEKEDNLIGMQLTELSSPPSGAPVSPLLRTQRRDTVAFRATCKSLTFFWLCNRK